MTSVSTARPMRGALAAALLAAVAAVSCGDDQHDPKSGSNSNWLVACVDEHQCTESRACLCGACSRECIDDNDCAGLEGARCSFSDRAAAVSQCGGANIGLCLPSCTPGSCAAGQSCVDGSCVLAEIPDSEFCAPALQVTADTPANEEAMLTLIQRNRLAGSIACASGTSLEPAPGLKLDGRLSCAARIKALDQARTQTRGMLDSEGRTPPERLTLAGYPFSSWWESYAFAADTPSEAYELLLADDDSCPQLGSSAYSSVGIGNAGDVFVVTLAGE
jgi:hypothetical protein